MAVEIGDFLLVPWTEFELLRGPEDVRVHLERYTGLDDDAVDHYLKELGFGQVAAVRRRLPRFGADTSRRVTSTPLRELLPPATPAAPALEHAAVHDEPPPVQHWVELTLVTDDGVPIAGAEVEIADDWGFVHRATTDADGRVRVDVPSDWLHHVRFAESIRLPELPEDPRPVDGIRVSRNPQALRVSTNASHLLVVERPRATVVSIDGWAEARAVLVFGTMRESEGGSITVRGALRTLLTLPTGGELHVVGHADTEGKKADNEALALERARSVQLYLAGKRQAWADHAFAHADVATLQAALAWAATSCGVPCDPGDIDGDWGPATADALAGLRSHAGIDQSQPLGPDDWAAIYDLYDRDLARLMLTDAAGLAAARARLGVQAAATMGERWPVDAPELDDHECPANRRVDLVRCAAGTSPRPGTDELYDGTFVLEHHVVGPERRIELLVVDPGFRPLPGGRARVGVGPLGDHELVANDGGIISITTLCGDPIRVRAANDADGGGQFIGGGVGETGGVG